MERLTLDEIEVIGRYLSLQDLTSCSSVSRSWRQIFDSTWRRHCDPILAEHLQTVECRVEPKFPSSGDEDSSLSSTAPWRKSYMRELHLWENWRHGRCSSESLIDTSSDITSTNQRDLCYFVNNDYLITASQNRVKLWDIRNTPLYVSDPFQLLSGTCVDFCQTLKNNRIIIVQNTNVQVLHFDSPIKSVWTVEYVFFFDGMQTVTLQEAEDLVPSVSNISTNHSLVIKRFFVGISKSLELHIWDLNWGKKLHTVRLPERKLSLLVKTLQAKDSMDFVLVLKRESRYYYHIFSLTKMDFFQLKIDHFANNYESHNPCCAFLDSFLAIGLPDKHCRVYNYRTSEVILNIDADGSVSVVAFNQDFVFITKLHFLLFNTTTKTHHTIPQPITDIEGDLDTVLAVFQPVCGRFLRVQHYRGGDIWEIWGAKTPTQVMFRPEMNSCVTTLKTNNACTKAVRYNRGVVEIVSFW